MKRIALALLFCVTAPFAAAAYPGNIITVYGQAANTAFDKPGSVSFKKLEGEKDSGNERDAEDERGSDRETYRNEVFSVHGQAINTTYGESSGVSFKIIRNGNRYSAVGRFNSVNLFGRFRVSGVQLSECDPEFTCLKFRGILYLGGDGSGFAYGTRTSYTMNIVIKGDRARGSYLIGVLPTIGVRQYGKLRLVVD